ncbi:MAG: cytochrome D1 domain-containing protein [Chloroflexota bacterium]
MLGACSTISPSPSQQPSGGPNSTAPSATAAATLSPTPEPTPNGVYGWTVSGRLAPAIAGLSPRVYVANEHSGDVAVIDPATLKVIDRYKTGKYPEHVVPDWDLSKLYVNNMSSSTITVIDPVTSKPTGEILAATTPYDLYYTPDGSKAIVVNDYINPDNMKFNGLNFYDRATWKFLKFLVVPWIGADDLDMSADGSFLMISCEYSGMVARVDTKAMTVTGSVKVGSLPRDVRLGPDGKLFFVTNEGRAGVSVIDPEQMKEINFIKTGAGAHAIEFSRDLTQMYVLNRSVGTVSVIDLATQTVVATWQEGRSPDEMTLSVDGTQAWFSDRYHGGVTVMDTRTGAILATIPTGDHPHGITYWPQPGLHSIGQNGNMR